MNADLVPVPPGASPAPPLIPKHLLFSFFKKAYQAAHPADSDSSASDWVQSHVFDETTYMIKPEYVSYLLYRLGFLMPA
ncbi:MAG: hypothetical protein Q8O19_04755 [Rectinemataceae bacterium]|nr:hypothetical protein [Rectinemataceae bacterium]